MLKEKGITGCYVGRTQRYHVSFCLVFYSLARRRPRFRGYNHAMNVKKLGLFFFLMSVSCMWNVKAGGVLRRKRQECVDGTYTNHNLQCCRCGKGHYVKEHCSTTKQTVCEPCEDGAFLDHANSEKACEPCKSCQSAANMEVQKKCTDTTNTVCHCQTGYFCDKGEECYSCHTCNSCEGLGVSVACTATNDTVCHAQGSNKAVIIPVVAVIISVVVVIAGVLLRKFLTKISSKTKTENEEMEPLSDDVDLAPHLYKIASVLKLQVVKGVARLSLTEVEMERQEINHRDNAEEWAYKLLEAWYQKHGERGAGNALIKSLSDQGKKADACHVRRIIRGEEWLSIS